MNGSESELIQLIEIVVMAAAVYYLGYSAGKSRGFVEAVKMAVVDGKAKAVIEKTDPPGEPPPPPGVCPYCGGKTRVIKSHRGKRVIVCDKCGPVNLVVARKGGAE